MTSPAPRRQVDRGRSLLADHLVRTFTFDGHPSCLIGVRLPSYRSLPLSCIDDIAVRLNGRQIDPDRIELILEGHTYRLDELPGLDRTWWFILEVGALRVRLDAPLGDTVDVEARLVTVEPYISNGRFHFASAAHRELGVIHA